MKKMWCLGGVVATLAIGSAVAQTLAIKAQTAPGKVVRMDLDKALTVNLPQMQPLKAAAFRTPDGRTGWVVKLPGDRPIATPAYANGKIFVGGGFGSHEFYAFDAARGDLDWKITTSDDVPTAAVVEDDCVAFNTESCTVIVTDARTGRILWQEWLGDPLMSQPAISHGRLYIAYPAGQRNHPKSRNSGYGFRMLCADLHTGAHFWEQDIPTDVISAPVVEKENLYFTCMNGTSFCLDALSGAVKWTKQNSGASAPLIVDGKPVFTQKQVENGRIVEGIRRMDSKGAFADRGLIAEGSAQYLSAGRGGGVALSSASQKSMDASVGFSSAPAAAKMATANTQLGVNSIVGGWAYQGSRVAHGNGQFYNAQGLTLNGMSASGKAVWRSEARGKNINTGQQLFSPPSMGAHNMYLGSGMGYVAAVRQSDGAPKFLYNFKEPIVFQPALANGNVYMGTANGLLICLKTGDKDADGWTMWGGNAQHNKG